MSILVCPLIHVEEVVRQRSPSHLITLLDPMHETVAPAFTGRRLRVDVNDIVEPMEGLILADAPMVESLLAFGRDWDAAAPILVHCWAGISRSTATAFILACERNPQADEAAIARALRQASPTAHPNPRFVAVADDLLGRGGRMVDALKAMGGADFFAEGGPFELPAAFPAGKAGA